MNVLYCGIAWDEVLLTILVLNETVEENTSHGNGVTREVRVVVHTVTDFETSRRVGVTGKEREDVVLSGARLA